MKLEVIESEQLVEIVRVCPFAIVICDSQSRIQYLNQAACDLLQVQKNVLVGELASEALQGITPALAGNVSRLVIRPPKQSREIPVESQIRFVGEGAGRLSVLFLQDAEQKSQREINLEKEATTDVLSGLANRRGFQRKLEASLSGKLSLAIIDIDHFKAINDNQGHVAGDDVIKEVGRRILELFDDCIVAARTGGDEFGVLCHSADSETMLQKLEELQKGLQDAEKSFNATISIGAAISWMSGLEARELLTRADRCLYEAKESGRNQMRYVTCQEPL